MGTGGLLLRRCSCPLSSVVNLHDQSPLSLHAILYFFVVSVNSGKVSALRCEERRQSSTVLHLGAIWRRVANFTPRYPMDRRLGVDAVE
jgi:hypothetical protein